jgi:hypothetical protein
MTVFLQALNNQYIYSLLIQVRNSWKLLLTTTHAGSWKQIPPLW